MISLWAWCLWFTFIPLPGPFYSISLVIKQLPIYSSQLDSGLTKSLLLNNNIGLDWILLDFGDFEYPYMLELNHTTSSGPHLDQIDFQSFHSKYFSTESSFFSSSSIFLPMLIIPQLFTCRWFPTQGQRYYIILSLKWIPLKVMHHDSAVLLWHHNLLMPYI